MQQLSSSIKITKVKDHSSANTTAVNSDGVNMAGYEGVLFLTSFGTAASDNTVNLAQSSDDGGSDAYSDLADTSVTSGSSDEDVWLNIWRPQKQYVRLEAARGTSTTLESIWAIQYGPRVMIVDNTTTGTIVGEAHHENAEGTA